MQIYNRGITTIGSVISIIIVIVVLGAGGYYLYKGNSNNIMDYNPNSVNNLVTETDEDVKISTNLCDYLTPALVAKYIKTPLVMDSDPHVSKSLMCGYSGVGGDSNTVVVLQLIGESDQENINNVYRRNLESKFDGKDVFKDDSQIGFKAWYTVDNYNNNVILYFASKRYIVAVGVKEKGASQDGNLSSAENLAKAIYPKLPN